MWNVFYCGEFCKPCEGEFRDLASRAKHSLPLPPALGSRAHKFAWIAAVATGQLRVGFLFAYRLTELWFITTVLQCSEFHMSQKNSLWRWMVGSLSQSNNNFDEMRQYFAARLVSGYFEQIIYWYQSTSEYSAVDHQIYKAGGYWLWNRGLVGISSAGNEHDKAWTIFAKSPTIVCTGLQIWDMIHATFAWLFFSRGTRQQDRDLSQMRYCSVVSFAK